MASDTAVDIGASLRECGLRVTSQRRAIMAVLAVQDEGHLTADEVFQRARCELPELARATVYNTLGELVRVGVVRVVETPGALRYEADRGDEHQHFRCFGCGRLFDVHPEGVSQVTLLSSGFVVKRTQVLLEGWCPGCKSGI